MYVARHVISQYQSRDISIAEGITSWKKVTCNDWHILLSKEVKLSINAEKHFVTSKKYSCIGVLCYFEKETLNIS